MNEEIWKDIDGYPGYKVSNLGRILSTRRGTERILSSSDDGNGYQKVMIYDSNGVRHCRKVHRIVAEVFVPHDPLLDTVDHIRSGPEGKLDNSVNNLRWITRADNIKKAYSDGVCDERIKRQNKAIIATDIWTGEEAFYPSINDASYATGVERSSISHVLRGDQEIASHYRFDYAGREDILLYGLPDY